MSKPLRLAALGAVSIALAAPAHADTDDDTAFLNAIHARGIPDERNGVSTISVAHTMCQALADGYSMNALDLGRRVLPEVHTLNGFLAPWAKPSIGVW